MASAKNYYPDNLNPFGDDDDETSNQDKQAHADSDGPDDYPDHLSPFGDEESSSQSGSRYHKVDDYDNSLNPFEQDESDSVLNCPDRSKAEPPNPFEEDGEETTQQSATSQHQQVTNTPHVQQATPESDLKSSDSHNAESTDDNHLEPHSSLELPPVPLPRTKSLLKKSQLARQRQSTHPFSNSSSETPAVSISSFEKGTSDQNATPSNDQSSDIADNVICNGSIPRRKQKRVAPPVPINFKRQVSGSLDEIENELNEIGDILSLNEKNTNECQEILKRTHDDDDTQEFESAKEKFCELIRRKNSIVRKQKGLMYKKRELKLDQIHSDIEYELRMIGNKQLSSRTAQDEAREKELLGKLVEIVEEKSDIVENLNKDINCDIDDIEEAFRRLNLSGKLLKRTTESNEISKDSIKDEACDRSNSNKVNKFSKIATLIPKSDTIKGTIKAKRKSLFKKIESKTISR